MAQLPKWYRRKQYEHKLRHILNNPLADISDVQAARRAVDKKLENDDRDYSQQQHNKVNKLLEKL